MISTVAVLRPPRKLLAFALMALLLRGSFSNYALAAPGGLDPFFGGSGKHLHEGRHCVGSNAFYRQELLHRGQEYVG